MKQISIEWKAGQKIIDEEFVNFRIKKTYMYSIDVGALIKSGKLVVLKFSKAIAGANT